MKVFCSVSDTSPIIVILSLISAKYSGIVELSRSGYTYTSVIINPSPSYI